MKLELFISLRKALEDLEICVLPSGKAMYERDVLTGGLTSHIQNTELVNYHTFQTELHLFIGEITTGLARTSRPWPWRAACAPERDLTTQLVFDHSALLFWEYEWITQNPLHGGSRRKYVSCHELHSDFYCTYVFIDGNSNAMIKHKMQST